MDKRNTKGLAQYGAMLLAKDPKEKGFFLALAVVPEKSEGPDVSRNKNGMMTLFINATG